MIDSDDLFGSEPVKFDYQKPPCTRSGDDMQMTYSLADLSKEELYNAIHIRAAMWDLINFARDSGCYSDFKSFDELISFASRKLRDDEEMELFRLSYDGRKREYQSMRVRLKRDIIKRGDKLECRHCGSIDRISIDHIHPLARGGSNDLNNLQFLCRTCNSKKHDKIV